MIEMWDNYLSTDYVLDPQPKVLVKDFDGLPIKGKKVVAFTWIEASYGNDEGSDTYVNG